MLGRVFLMWVLSAVGVAAFGIHSSALAFDDLSPDPDIPLSKRLGDSFDDDNYRYDFGDRHLTFGLDGGVCLANGGTLNAFPVGGIVTPYFRGAFGDGNALEFDMSYAFNPISSEQLGWLFFRTPLTGGSVSGQVMFLAPSIAARYEIELTSSISRRARYLMWIGVGVGPTFILGDATLTGNTFPSGQTHDRDPQTFEVYFDLIPTIGFKAYLNEFAFLQIGLRSHLMLLIGAKVSDDDKMTFGSPNIIQEFWIGNVSVFDGFLGFGYDFK